jgi:hypothetical protein
MVNQSLDEQRQWAESEVERLETNLINLKSLNASKIGIQMAEEELDKAKAALAVFQVDDAREAPASGPTEPIDSSEPISDAPFEESPEPVEQQHAEESLAVNQEPEEPVSDETPVDVASEPVAEAAEEAPEETAEVASDPTDE